MQIKSFYSVIFVLFIFGAQCLYAQVDKPYFSDDSHKVPVSAWTTLYLPLGDYDVERIQKERYSDDWGTKRITSTISYLESLNKIRVTKNTDLPVIGFIKSEIGLEDYDFYIVDYNGRVCYLSKDSCRDNTLIDAKNRDIHNHYSLLKSEIEKLSDDYYSGVISKAQNAQNQLEVLVNRESIIIDSLTQVRTALEENLMLKAYNEWEANLDATGKNTSRLLIIHHSELAPPNSASGCDYSLSFTNNSPKTIKYLDWKGNVYNAVNDIVSCEVRGTNLLQGRVTGPIGTNEEYSGTWETVIYNWSSKRMHLTGISIIYTDGSKASLSAKEVNSIIGSPYKKLSLRQIGLIKSDSWMEVHKRIDNLKEISHYLSYPAGARYSESESFEPEREIYKQITELAKEFQSLRLRNNLPSWEMPDDIKALGLIIY